MYSLLVGKIKGVKKPTTQDQNIILFICFDNIIINNKIYEFQLFFKTFLNSSLIIYNIIIDNNKYKNQVFLQSF